MEEIKKFLSGEILDYETAVKLFFTYRPTNMRGKYNDTTRSISPYHIILLLETIVNAPISGRCTTPKAKLSFNSYDFNNIKSNTLIENISAVETYTTPSGEKIPFHLLPEEVQNWIRESINLQNQREGIRQAICEMPEDNQTESIVASRKAMSDEIDEKTARIDELQAKIDYFNRTNEILEQGEETEIIEAETNQFKDWSPEKLLVEIGKKRSSISMDKKKLKEEGLDADAILKVEKRLAEKQAVLDAMQKELEMKEIK